MSRPFLPKKAKRNNFTLSLSAQSIVDGLRSNKSKFVSDAIIAYFALNATPIDDSTTEDIGS
jgi:hypothetical protein